MTLSPEKMAELTREAEQVMQPVLTVAARRLVQSLEVAMEREAEAVRTRALAPDVLEEVRTELRIVASVPVPESPEANSLGWLKARARALLEKLGEGS